MGTAEAACDKVDCVGCSSCKNDFCIAMCVYVTCYCFAGLFVRFGREPAQVVNASVNIGVDGRVYFFHFLYHADWFLGCCGVVEVDQGFVVDFSVEDWEVFSYFVCIEHGYLFWCNGCKGMDCFWKGKMGIWKFLCNFATSGGFLFFFVWNDFMELS